MTPEEKRAYDKVYYKSRRKWVQQAKDHLGGKCFRCESVDDLHFHHLRDKLFTVAEGNHNSKDFWAEVEKCILLCAECHRKEHAAPEHGVTRYKYGCRCSICSQAKYEYQQEFHDKRRRKKVT